MPTKLSRAARFSTLRVLIPSWERSLRAGNKSARTVRTYVDAASFFDDFTTAHYGDLAVDRLKREHVEVFIADQLERHKATTASVRYRALQQLFKWLLEEGEIEQSPMANMKPPIVPEVPVPVVTDADLKALLKTCSGTTFEDRRDLAILRVFIDTGVRLAECTRIELSGVDLDQDVIIVTGKGRRPRAVPFGAKTAQALDRYLRLRARHKAAEATALWLGQKGPMQESGIAQMLERRCDKAGITRIHPHQLRHTAAHVWMAAGGLESDAMRLFGWKSRTMLSRYGASAADERAREAHRRLAPGNRI